MIWVGCDPGRSGAIAFVPDLPDDGEPWFLSLSDSMHDLSEGVRAAHTVGNLYCALESVHSSPQMGVKSAFTFGQSFGQVEMLLVALQVPYERVSPQRWQKDLRCLTGGDKRVTKRIAANLFPRTRVTHRNADALLLAVWARQYGHSS